MAISNLDIMKVISERKIKWLCHFTPRKNLENIKRNGLKSRDLLNSDNFVVTDHSRYDQYRNSICLSISKPNQWMFNKKQEQGFDLCLILLKPDILFKKKCLFYPHNAATASYRNLDIDELQGVKALEKLFSDSVSFQKSGREPQNIYRNQQLDICETTSDQAEVQCLEVIEPEYIIHIFEENIPLTYQSITKFISNGALGLLMPNHNSSIDVGTSIFNATNSSLTTLLARLDVVESAKILDAVEPAKIKPRPEMLRHIKPVIPRDSGTIRNETNTDKGRGDSNSSRVSSAKSNENTSIRHKPSIDQSYTSSKSSSGSGCLLLIIVVLILMFVF